MKFIVNLASSGLSPGEVIEMYKNATQSVKSKKKKYDLERLNMLLLEGHEYVYEITDKYDHTLFISFVDL